MLLATLLLLCPLPQGDVAKSIANAPADVAADATEASSSRNLPSMPTPKVTADVAADGVNSSVAASAAGVEPPVVALPIQPLKPVYIRPRETRGQRIVWYTLSATSSGAAAFDAWSTRRAISRGYGTEGNPFLRPFSHSNAIYAATQVSPAVMDYIGKRMMVSQNRWVRRLWWVPQAAGSGFSVFAGVHNTNLVP
jgi:hypothetical protein